MPKFEHTIVINAALKTILKYASRVEEIPAVMPDVKEVKILEDEGSRRITLWRASSSGVTLEWKQEDIIDVKNGEFRFRAIEGDLRKYQGEWEFKEKNGKAEITLKIEVDFGIPVLGAFLNSFLTKKLQQNAESLMKILKERVEKGE